MNQDQTKLKDNEGKIIWKSVLILIPTPILAAILVPWYGIVYGFGMGAWITFGAFMIATGVAITMGYHRLWSHKAFKANVVIRFLLMFFGAGAFQNSILQWASDHRKHHRHVDHPVEDPYSASNGFWYSHFGWMLRYPKAHVEAIQGVDDLKKDWVVRLQHNYYVPIAVLSGVVLPLAIGWTFGSMIGCFLLAGLLRTVLNHHFTFFINSLAHTVGKQKFSDKNTSRDNPFISLVTYGEGYHNFHHAFAGDYRNGIQWYDFDPSKWLIAAGSKVGLCWDLKRTPQHIIELSKAKMQLLEAQKKLENRTATAPILERLEQHYHHLQTTMSAWAKAKQQWLSAKKEQLPKQVAKELKLQYKTLKRELNQARQVWRARLAVMPAQVDQAA